MQRSTNPFILTGALVAVASIAVGATVTGVDPSTSIHIAGPVIAFTGASGSGMPMIAVDDATLGVTDVGLAPAWYLREAGFTAEEGDQVEILAFECPICAALYVAAWVENLTAGGTTEFRDDDGRPLWRQRQAARGGSARPGQGQGGGSGAPGGSGNGNGSGPSNGSGLDMSQITEVSGTVVDFVGHAGSGQPLLTLDVGGEVIEIVVSPYQPVLAAGLVIEAGMELTVTYAPTACDDNPQNISIAIRDPATGLLIQLRDPETGFPMAPGGGHNRPNWP